jgi:hypothetical protein
MQKQNSKNISNTMLRMEFSQISVYNFHAAPPPDEEAWMQDLGSIMDMNVDTADELELLHDSRNGYDDLAYARDLDRAAGNRVSCSCSKGRGAS